MISKSGSVANNLEVNYYLFPYCWTNSAPSPSAPQVKGKEDLCAKIPVGEDLIWQQLHKI